MRATIANMQKFYPKYKNALVWVPDDEPFGETEYSANPDDYFTISDINEDLGGELVVKISTAYTQPS